MRYTKKKHNFRVKQYSKVCKQNKQTKKITKLKPRLRTKRAKTRLRPKIKKYKSCGGAAVAFGHIIQNAIYSGSDTLNTLRGIESTPNPLPWKDQF